MTREGERALRWVPARARVGAQARATASEKFSLEAERQGETRINTSQSSGDGVLQSH